MTRGRGVADEKEFERKMQRVGTLVEAIEAMQEPGSRAKAREIVQLLMEVHGTAIERMMELIFEFSPPEQSGGADASQSISAGIIDKLARDPIVRSMLLLYSLHPDDLESRVTQAVELAGERLRKLNASVELASLEGNEARFRLHVSGHACGSTVHTLQSTVEECLYELAPDLASVAFLESSDGGASGFVPLDRLWKQPATSHGLAVPTPASLSVARDAEGEGAH